MNISDKPIGDYVLLRWVGLRNGIAVYGVFEKCKIPCSC